jgi:hypothetical protein
MWTTHKKDKLNLGSTVITWSAIGYWFSFSATSVTCDILSFKTSHFISTTKHLWCDSLWEIPFYRTSRELTMFWKDFLEFLSWIKTHPIQTSHLILLTDFCIIFKSVCGSIVSTVTWICTGSSWVQILAGAYALSLLHNIQTNSSTHTGSNSMKTRAFSISKVSSAQSDHSHLSRPKYKNQCSYTSTQPVSLHGTYWNNFILPLSTTYVHISQQVSSFLVL